MRGVDLRAPQVKQTITRLLAARPQRPSPAWLEPVRDVPPSEILTRTIPIQHRRAPVTGRRKVRKASKLFIPQKLHYEEDSLRAEFFKDHPWELARPRTMLETDGKDARRWDWSQAYEVGRPVNGESVVQRQRFLMKEKALAAVNALGSGSSQVERERTADTAYRQAEDEAYDQVRKEFYRARHEDEVEARVAREEALATGARFKNTTLDFGMTLENKSFDKWRTWAEEEATIAEQRRATAYGGTGQGAASLVEDAQSPSPAAESSDTA